MNYIWLEENTPIKQQIPSGYKSVAIVLNPFIRMPMKWIEEKKIDEDNEFYLTSKDILEYGRSVSWAEILEMVDLKTYVELELALKSSILSFNKTYRRLDLENKLNNNLPKDIFYPDSDKISEIIIQDFCNYILSIKSKKLYYDAPITQIDGCVNINEISPLDICEMYHSEIIISDEFNEYLLMSEYDSFFTILISKNDNINKFIDEMKWEAIICDENTKSNWYLKADFA